MKAKRKFKDYALKHAKIRKDKKVKGFTLVELIIVIAIIGILAAILIPTISGKVKDAKLQTANDAAAKIGEQAAIILADFEAAGNAAEITNATGDIIDSAGSYSAGTIGKYLQDTIPKNVPAASGSKWKILITKDGAIAGVTYAAKGGGYLGRYPNPKKGYTNVADGGTLADPDATASD